MKILSYIRFTEMDETIQWLEKHNVFFAPCNLRERVSLLILFQERLRLYPMIT